MAMRLNLGKGNRVKLESSFTAIYLFICESELN